MDLLLFGQPGLAQPSKPVHSSDHSSDQSSLDLDREKRFVFSVGLVQQSRLLGLFVVFILLIIIINTALVIFILVSKAMRNSSRHVLILSVCVGDLLMGIFVLPALLDIGLQGDNNMNCTVFYATRLFADFLIPSVTTIAMLALNIDYILRLVYSGYSDGSGRNCLLTLLFLAPWILSCAILIPLYVDVLNSHRGDTSYWWETCTITMAGHETRVLLVLSFFPQAALLLISNIVVSFMYLVWRESCSLDAAGERIRAPVDICLASFSTILFYTPIFLLYVFSSEGYVGCRDADECRTVGEMATVLVWLLFTKSWFLPLAWFTCKDTRMCIRNLFYCY